MSTNMVVYFDWKTVIHIYVCRQCRTQFMLPNSSRRQFINIHIYNGKVNHVPAHVLMRLYPIDKSLVCLQNERRTSCQNVHLPSADFLSPLVSFSFLRISLGLNDGPRPIKHTNFNIHVVLTSHKKYTNKNYVEQKIYITYFVIIS